MDKQNLISKIGAAKIPEDFKKELVQLVEEEAAVGPETVKKIQARIDEFVEQSIDSVTNLQVMDAAEEFGDKMAKVDGEIKQFNQELNQKADEADMAAARNTISQQ